MMKAKYFFLTIIILSFTSVQSMAQCALCTKTAQQLGDGPAAGLNKGILYLMFIPLALILYIGYRWYRKERVVSANEKR